MFSFTIRIFLATLLFTLAAHADEALLTLEEVETQSPVTSEMPPTFKEILPPEKYEPVKIWGAIPAGLIGFGLGQTIQERSTTAKAIPAVFDGAVMFFLIGTIGGHCGELTSEPPEKIQKCRDKESRIVDNIGKAMIVSRLIQVVDLSIYSVGYYKKFHVSAFILPNEKGQQLTLAFEF